MNKIKNLQKYKNNINFKLRNWIKLTKFLVNFKKIR